MLRFVCGTLAFLALSVPTYTWAQDEAALKQKIRDFNQVTGSDTMSSIFKGLLADKDRAKRLIKTAAGMAKETPQPLSYNSAFMLGLAAAEFKDFANADTLFHVCADMGFKLQSPDRLLNSYGALIDLYNENKKYEESELVCREILGLKSDDTKPRRIFFPVVTPLGETDFEQVDGDAAKLLGPGIQRLMVQSIARQGKYDQALKLTEMMIKKSQHWREKQLKAWVLEQAGTFDEAAKTYEEVIDDIGKDMDPELNRKQREALQDRERYLLSNVYVEAKQIDKAIEQLQTLLTKHPDDPGYNNDLGYIWADHDMNLAEAEKLIRNALKLDEQERKNIPDLAPEEDVANGAYLDSLGWVLYKKKDYKEAKEVMLKAVEDKGAQHIEIYDHLAEVLMALGDRQGAIQAWTTGLEHLTESRRDQERKAAVEKKLKDNK